MAAPLLASLPVLVAPQAAADGLRLIDFTERLVTPEQIKAAGYAGALVYVSELRPGADFDFKPVTHDYTDGLRAAGLHIVSCYQYGKPGWPTPSDFTRGYDGGVADAQTALRLHGAAGGPATAPIFFSVDEDIDERTWKPRRPNGSGVSTRCWAFAVPAFMVTRAPVAGPSATM